MDERFVRDGRSLRQWLPELLGPDAATRRRAENAVCAMRWGAPVADATVYKYVPADPEGHRRDWAETIAGVLSDPAFPGADFVTAALARVKQDRREAEAVRALENRLFHDDPPLSEGDRAALLERIRRANDAINRGRLPNSSHTLTLHNVLECAGRVLLRLPHDAVAEALRDTDYDRTVAEALARTGPAAAAFAADLLEPAPDGGDPARPTRRLRFPAVLAAIGREDRATVARLLELVRLPEDGVAFSAADTLGRMGPDVTHQVPGAVDVLLSAYDAEPGRRLDLLECMARIDPGRAEVFERVREAAAPGEPDMQAIPGYERYPYDATMHRRGAAIDALRHMTPFAARAVPILIDAVGTFVEYDPDEEQLGVHARVIRALAGLGPAGAAAVTVLLPHLRSEDGELNGPLVRWLARLGPEARAALPALREIRDGEGPIESPPDELFDPIGYAIHRIAGGLV